MDDFESLLEKKRNLVDVYKKRKEATPKSSIQTAEKNANVSNLISMINKLVTLVLSKDYNVVFCPDEQKEHLLVQNEKIDKNYITYRVISREPKNELKPRIREEIFEKTNDKNEERIGFINGQCFKTLIQFNIFCPIYTDADTIMEEFEKMIETYTGFFERSGIGKIIFQKQLSDEHYDIYREILSVRNIQYYVETERLSVIFREKVKEIETLLSEKED